MMERETNDYWLPAAWRGVASPGYLHLSRWHSLVEELGGLRASPAGAGGPGGTPPDPLTKSGCMDMSVLAEVQPCEQLDELREFVLTHLARHERLVLMLVHAEGLSLEQTAEVLDLPVATVSRIYARTVTELRARLRQSS
ncbi:MAG TPA: sigma-70 family RNA polymerase sigma factor [Planctomycetota bacterium]|nr:sigma-70 family RNA polymerase sigma factor [Planctomycetota bacterium]HRR81914.1 sigma-70 family RNA polymerase sigma factor [Planctomycetota bacterium]HRT94313.1 sigma-70 family RNA polymerase sigma factor [Planctomycetota bacterium]